MSLNKTLIALAFALALTACSKGEEAATTEAAAEATEEAAVATDAAADATAAAADATAEVAADPLLRSSPGPSGALAA